MRPDLEVIAEQVVADRSYALSIDPSILREIIRRLLLERRDLHKALKPLASKKVPLNPQGNAGMYSFLFSEIEFAQAALSD